MPAQEAAGAVPVRRVRKAYEQVADQLRDLIVAGELARGERLPNEQLLAREFGVSRATVREALRVLAAQSLIRTAKGAGGGSYVTVPSVDHISEFLTSNIGLLADSRDVTLDELLEARELLEVPVVRLAAERRSPHDLERLHAAIPGEPVVGHDERFGYDREFHAALVASCRNSLLSIAAQPLFSVLATSVRRSAIGPDVQRETASQHARIADAVAEGDAEAAAGEMRLHLDYLRGVYERAWVEAAEQPARARP